MDQDNKKTERSGNLNDIKVEELFDLDDIQRMQDLFSGATGVASVITAIDGRPLTRPSNFRSLFSQFILKQEKGLIQSFRLEHSPEADSGTSGDSVARDRQVFLDARARITIRGRHVANWLIGQVRTTNPDLQWIQQYSDKTGADRDEFIEALNEVPVMTVQQFGKVSDMLVAFADELTRNAAANQMLKLQVAEKEKAVKSLNESLLRNNALLDAIPDLMFVFDSEGRFIDYHAERSDNLFVAPEFFLGKKPEEVLPRELSALTSKEVKAVIETGKPQHSNYKLEVRGDLRYFESRGVPCGIGQVLSIVRDITDMKRSAEQQRESEERYLTVLNASPDNITIADLEGNVVMFSPVAITMFGYETADELLGHHILEFIHPSDRTRANGILELMFQGTMPGPAEYLGLRKDGSTFYIEVNAEFIRGADKLPKQIVFICRDIDHRKITEEALRESEEKYRLISENTSDGIIIFGPDHLVKYVSPAYIKQLGYDESEEVGRNPETIHTIIHPEDRDTVFKSIFSAIESKKTRLSYSYRVKHKEGHYIWREDNSQFKYDESGNYKGAYVICRDITQRKIAEKELRDNERILQQAQEVSRVGHYVTDLATGIWTSSPVLDEIFGIDDSFVRNIENWGSIITPEHRTKMVDYYHQVVKEKSRFEMDYQVKRPANGEIRWISALGEMDYDIEGKAVRMIGTIQDITERKRIEYELMEMIVKIGEAREKAEAGNRLKTAFMNNISHEIRTPLNGILGFTNLITQPDISDEEKERFCSLIKSSSNRLLGTITNYMDISLIASGTIEMKSKPFNLNRFLTLLFEHSKPVCNEKNLDLRLEIPDAGKSFTIDSDQEIIHKVLSHLIDNAVKFTERGEISFGYELNKGVCRLFVKDSGIGISKESLSVIFDSFVQERLSPTSGHEGSGLGLSIAQGMVCLLGSKIIAESEKNSGSTFFFELPYKGYEANTINESDIKDSVNAPVAQLILIAEDDDANFELSHAMLRKSKVRILKARNGAEALAQCRANHEISLVLMDLKMPGMDGLQATRQIKSFRKSLPVIAITAFALSGDEKRAIEAGCDDYIAKPVEKEALLGKLRRYGIDV